MWLLAFFLCCVGRCFSTSSVEVPAIPIKSKKLIMRSACQLYRRNWIGFNWIFQHRLTSLSAAFSEILGYTCLHKLLDLLVSLVRVSLGSVCNLKFSYFRIFQGVFCACCPLPQELSVLFLWTEKTLPWVCFQSSLQEFECLKPPCSCSPSLQRICCGP